MKGLKLFYLIMVACALNAYVYADPVYDPYAKKFIDFTAGTGGAPAVGTVWEIITTGDHNAVSGHGYMIDSSGGAVNLTMPVPVLGVTVPFRAIDSTNTITIKRNGVEKIESQDSDLVLNVSGVGSNLVYADATRGWVVQTNTTGIGGGGGASTVWEVITAGSYDAVSGHGYMVDSSGGVVNLTLPAMTLGASYPIRALDSTNTITIKRTGSDKIESLDADMAINVGNAGFSLVGSDATRGWVIQNNIANIKQDVSIPWSFITSAGQALSKNSIYVNQTASLAYQVELDPSVWAIGDKVEVVNNATPTVAVFNTTGTFTTAVDITAEVLVVGGGGGGGGGWHTGAGGGGAGGLQHVYNYAISAGTYTVTVGDGGFAGNQDGSGYQGGSSQFSTLIAGGGLGGRESDSIGGTSGTPQGNLGGNPFLSGGKCGGGGAGAGAMGWDCLIGRPGHGGNGLAISITGVKTWYAGGGASDFTFSNINSIGGLGGGGSVAYDGAVQAGTANTGGGGAGEYAGAGAAGGSGIVIIKYSAKPITVNPANAIKIGSQNAGVSRVLSNEGDAEEYTWDGTQLWITKSVGTPVGGN